MVVEERELIETEDGPVELTGLSNQEKLICFMLEHIDENAYDGADVTSCLIGKPAATLGCDWNYFDVVEFIASKFDLDYNDVYSVYMKAARPRYAKNFKLAMNMAREELGVTRF